MPTEHDAASVRLPKPWFDFLRDVDTALPCPVSLHCVGGFVLAALYGMPRPTGDLDYVEVVPKVAAITVQEIGGKDSALARKHRLFLQDVMGIADYPDGYESRMQELALSLQNLKLWALDPYDLLLCKLPRNSPKDREDARNLIHKLALKSATFQARWEQEMNPWIPNRERHALTVKLWREYFAE